MLTRSCFFFLFIDTSTWSVLLIELQTNLSSSHEILWPWIIDRLDNWKKKFSFLFLPLYRLQDNWEGGENDRKKAKPWLFKKAWKVRKIPTIVVRSSSFAPTFFLLTPASPAPRLGKDHQTFGSASVTNWRGPAAVAAASLCILAHGSLSSFSFSIHPSKKDASSDALLQFIRSLTIKLSLWRWHQLGWDDWLWIPQLVDCTHRKLEGTVNWPRQTQGLNREKGESRCL